jgi:hypothetical protein
MIVCTYPNDDFGSFHCTLAAMINAVLLLIFTVILVFSKRFWQYCQMKITGLSREIDQLQTIMYSSLP